MSPTEVANIPNFSWQGAAVIRMLSGFISERVFSKGLHVSVAAAGDQQKSFDLVNAVAITG